MSEENKDNPEDEDKKKKIFQMFRLIGNFKEVEGNDEEKLGEPDKIQILKDGKFYYKKSIWNTSMGQLIKVESMSHFTPEDYAKATKPKKTKKVQIMEDILEARELLDMAKDDEDYEYCAELRDRLKQLKIQLLEEKKNPTEATETEHVKPSDEWNF